MSASFIVPSSDLKNYPTYNFTGALDKDAAFRHVFVQQQAPLTVVDAPAPSPTPPAPSTVNAISPLTGDGTLADPLTVLAGSTPCSTLFWDGVAWRINRNPGMLEVTVGPAPSNANFATVQEALNMGCNFVRVVDDTTEPAILSITADTVIYVDPGKTLTLSVGIDIQLSAGLPRSLTLLGNAQTNSSRFDFQGPINTNVDSYLYINHCKIVNSGRGSLLVGNANQLGYVEANNVSFQASNDVVSLFGNGIANVGTLNLYNCDITSGGPFCQFFIDKSGATNIRNLTINSTAFVPSATLARTLGDVDIDTVICNATGSTTFAPYTWILAGRVRNFQQVNDSVVLNASNALSILTDSVVDSCVNLLGLDRMDNVTMTKDDGTFVPIIFSASRAQLTNMKFTGANGILITTDDLQMTNAYVGGSVNIPGPGTNVRFTNVWGLQDLFSGGGYFTDCQFDTQIQVTNTSLKGCRSAVLYIAFSDIVGGVYDDINPSGAAMGNDNRFVGVDCRNMCNTGPGLRNVFSGCRLNIVSANGGFDVLDNCTIQRGLVCGAGTLVSNCRVDTIGGGNDISLAGQPDVQISNCVVGTSPLGAVTSTITGITPAPGAGVTLIVNCKTRAAIAASAANINCFTF